MSELNKSVFVPDEHLDRKEQVLLEVLSYMCGYDMQPSLVYERREQSGKDTLVLRVDGMTTPWLVGSEIQATDGEYSADSQLTRSRRRVLHTTLVAATARAGRRLPNADGAVVASRVWEPTGDDECDDVANRREQAILALSHMERIQWVTSPDGGGARLTLRLLGHAYKGKRESWVASVWTDGSRSSIDRSKRNLSLRILEQFIRRDACVIDRINAQHRERSALSPQVEA